MAPKAIPTSARKTELEYVTQYVLDAGRMARLATDWEQDPHMILYEGFQPKIAVYVEKWISWKARHERFPYPNLRVPTKPVLLARSNKLRTWELWILREDMKRMLVVPGKIIMKYEAEVPAEVLAEVEYRDL